MVNYCHVLKLNEINTYYIEYQIETDNIELLKHPVVASFIYNIWNSRYGVVNFIYWAVYFFYLLIITAVLIWVLPNPTSAYCNAGNDVNISICMNACHVRYNA